MINKIGRAYHNANLSKLMSYKNAFLFVFKISEKQFMFDLFVTNWNVVKY